MRHLWGRTYATLRILLFSFVCAFAVSSCSRSDNGPKPPSGQVDPPVSSVAVPLISTVVSIAPTISAGIQRSISQYESVLTTSKVGEPLLIPSSNGKGDTLVLATDGEQNVRLAAMTAGPATVLSAETTAHALVRVMLGEVPNGRSVKELDSAIRSATSFAPLVIAVASEIDLGGAPMTSGAAAPLALDVAAQAMLQLAPPTAATQVAGGNGTKLLAISPIRAADLTPPYVVVGSTMTGVFIADGGVVVRNTLPMVWSANTSVDPTVVPLPAASVQGILTLQALSFGGLEGALANFVSRIETKTLKNNDGKAFDLSIFQDDASRSANTKALIIDVMGYVVTLMAADPLLKEKDDCVTKFVNATYKPEEAAAIYRSASADSLRNYAIAVAKSSVVGLAKTCLNISIPTPSALAEDAIKSVFSVAGKVVTNYIGIGGKAAAIAYYSNTPKITVGVCETPGSSFGFNLVNCAVRFEAAPLLMAPGAEAVLSIRAFDRGRHETATSTGLSITPFPDNGTVGIDEATRTVRALKTGHVDVTVVDKEVDVKTTVTVDVVEPVLTPNPLRVAPGSVATFYLKSPSKTDLVLPKSGMAPRSLDPAIAEFNPFGTVLFGSGSVSFNAKSGPQTTVTVSHPSWTTIPSATLIVDAPPPNDAIATIKFTSTSCTSISPPPQGPGYRNKFTVTGQITGPVGAFLGSRGVVKYDSPNGQGFRQSGDEGGLTDTCEAWALPNGVCARQSNDPPTTTFQFSGVTGYPEFAFVDILYQAPGTDRPNIVAEAEAPLSCPSD